MLLPIEVTSVSVQQNALRLFSDTEVTLNTFTHTHIFQFSHPCKRSWSCSSSQFIHLGKS